MFELAPRACSSTYAVSPSLPSNSSVTDDGVVNGTNAGSSESAASRRMSCDSPFSELPSRKTPSTQTPLWTGLLPTPRPEPNDWRSSATGTTWVLPRPSGSGTPYPRSVRPYRPARPLRRARPFRPRPPTLPSRPRCSGGPRCSGCARTPPRRQTVPAPDADVAPARPRPTFRSFYSLLKQPACQGRSPQEKRSPAPSAAARPSCAAPARSARGASWLPSAKGGACASS